MSSHADQLFDIWLGGRLRRRRRSRLWVIVSHEGCEPACYATSCEKDQGTDDGYHPDLHSWDRRWLESLGVGEHASTGLRSYSAALLRQYSGLKRSSMKGARNRALIVQLGSNACE
jgi:hypothetical protein